MCACVLSEAKPNWENQMQRTANRTEWEQKQIAQKIWRSKIFGPRKKWMEHGSLFRILILFVWISLSQFVWMCLRQMPKTVTQYELTAEVCGPKTEISTKVFLCHHSMWNFPSHSIRIQSFYGLTSMFRRSDVRISNIPYTQNTQMRHAMETVICID